MSIQRMSPLKRVIYTAQKGKICHPRVKTDRRVVRFLLVWIEFAHSTAPSQGRQWNIPVSSMFHCPVSWMGGSTEAATPGIMAAVGAGSKKSVTSFVKVAFYGIWIPRRSESTPS
ncbi:uncharacterized protein MCYG_04200 [Microsporum canis CBS 113480]|uniref:Uncharacterized protein n=1 Tax=Arthroderma otae (strain ATCC MYA-4605 / CBS 113480) TaxID=554155 RepID=C5FP65_ARTOC|nr:uncharacterized protein MCYG_04200 [Microsporum canis CBS 113480]EEQ31381.1 predicted protein [Microsporum canis CBS 113480]